MPAQGTPRTPVRAAWVAALAALVAGLTACVVERADDTAADAAGPDGPVAFPAPPGSTTTTYASLRLVPLGTVAYDGLLLPLISPDGRFAAVAQGQAPSWPTLLAEPDALVPQHSRIAIYRLEAMPAVRTSASERVPPGLVLGRNATAAGFLVEAPQPDGARWIGLIGWADASLTWLVQDQSRNAHAVYTAGDHLAFVRFEDGHGVLVLQSASGERFTLDQPDVSVLMPLSSTVTDMLYALGRTDHGLELLAVELRGAADGRGAMQLGHVVARWPISREADPLLAYQIAEPNRGALSTWPERSPAPTGQPRSHVASPPAVILFEPYQRRLVAFDASAPSSRRLLAAGTVAAVAAPLAPQPGLFATSEDGLVFLPEPSRPRAAPAGVDRPAVELLGSPYVPRATLAPDRPLILLGPSRAGPSQLEILALGFPGS